ncbi:MAG: AAA family ATPase, partial [bacterium]|nr:AAA family ATPase [bacterium]
KTTTAVNLSACLANDGNRTLLIDIDPQANATSGCEAGIDNHDGSVYEVLLGHAPLEAVICSTGIPGLDLAPSRISLAGAEVEMSSVLGREKRLTEALETVRSDYDFIIIDCPPSLGLLTVNALTAADSVLIPVQCEYYALEGLSKLLNSIQLVQRYLNPTLEIEGVLLTMYDERLQLSKRVAAEVKSYFNDKVYETAIKRNVSLAAAPSFGQPVILYEPRSTGADNYRRLASEVGHSHAAALA